MTSGAKRAFITLLLIAFAIGGANLLFTAREVNAVRHVAAAAARNAATIVQLCQAGNEARRQQIVLWEHLVAVAQPPPRESPAAKLKRQAVARAFLAYVHRVFAPRNCRHPLAPPSRGTITGERNKARKIAMSSKSFSNGNATNCASPANGPSSPATITITGVRLGAGDTHWARLV